MLFTNSQAIVQGSCGTPIGSGNCGSSCVTHSEEVIIDDTFVTIQPNPTKGEVHVNILNKINESKSIRVISALGVVINEYELSKNNNHLGIILPPEAGVYYIQIRAKDELITEKIVKL